MSPHVTFVFADAPACTIAGDVGQSVMEIARRAGVAGIIGECGGNTACGTCHVLVVDRWLGATGAVGRDEADMLDFVAKRAPNSRLACQIRLTPAMDGLIVHVPAS